MSGIALKLMGVTKNGGTPYYPLTNTESDPTYSGWRSNSAPAGYTFVPNDGIYSDEPITNMDFMFDSASSFNDPDIAFWDTSTVTGMTGAFLLAKDFNQDIGSWDVSNVMAMGGMFYRASSFNQDIGSWDVSNVEDIGSMFTYATSMTFPLGSWQTSLLYQPSSFSSNGNATFLSYRGTADFPLLADGVTRINT